MRLSTVFKCVGFATVVALAYINMQMQIFNLAYQGKMNENTIRELIEDNGNVTYKILMIKSANNLGYRLLEDDSGMQFGDPKNVVKFSVSEDFLVADSLTVEKLEEPKSNSLLTFLSFGSKAEARPHK